MKISALLLLAAALHAAPKPVKLQTIPATVTLTGAKAGQQLLATATYADGTQADVTSSVTWSIANPALATLNPTAHTVTVPLPEGTTVYYINLVDAAGRVTSTEHEVLGGN